MPKTAKKKKRVRRKDDRRVNRRVSDLIAKNEAQLEEWSIHVRRMELCVGRGDFRAAHKALDDYIYLHAPGAISLDSPLAALSAFGLGMEIIEMLEERNFETIRSLLMARREEVQRDWIGVKRMTDILNAIEATGLLERR